MERTKKCKYCGTEYKYTTYSEEVGEVERHEQCPNCGYFYDFAYSEPDTNEDIYEELKKYRDTNLTPAEAADLSKAKQEGRLVVLPCKVGDTVKATVNRPYNGHDVTIYGTITEIQPVIRVRHSGCRHVDFIASDFGKTVFLTREAAEAAMKGAEQK